MTQDHQSEPGRGRGAGRRDLQRERLIGRVESALIIGLFAVVCGHNYTAKGQYSSSIIIPKGYVQVEGDIITTESQGYRQSQKGVGKLAATRRGAVI